MDLVKEIKPYYQALSHMALQRIEIDLDEWEVLGMSDFTENYNDSMSRYAENISKMTQAVQGIYTSESYIRMIQSARRLRMGFKKQAIIQMMN